MRDTHDETVLTVSEVTARIKAVIETSLPVFWVEGEISNFVHHSSGHMYFSMKDEKSQLPCVMFKSANRGLAFAPESGMKVAAWGRVKVYEPSGRYQLYVESMKPAGLGALAAAFEKLKRSLAEEGLFDPEHKQSIPGFPSTVAIVTSPTGAAVRDMIRVIGERSPSTRIVVVPAPVQGRDAVPGIVEAIELIDEWGGADVAIVGRGGGSLEDLWAFNEEAVARAIHEARTPIISAVGHEIDTTIADLVADRRAATPSNAGEIVVPERRELMRSLEAVARRLKRGLTGTLDERARRLNDLIGAYAFRLPGELIDRHAQRTDDLSRRLLVAVSQRLEAARARVDRLSSELRLTDPSHIMARGFAAVSTLPQLSPVRGVTDVSVGAAVRVTVADGSFDCDVKTVTEKPGRES